MKRYLSLALLVPILYLSSSCSVYMATKQPTKKDLSVLSEGTPRSHVIAEIGPPIHTDELEDGKMDIYKFVQGYTKGAKVGRALFHGVADVFTLGIWEAVGTPIELIADGKEATLEVYYDKDNRVKTIKVISGEGVLKQNEKKEKAEADPYKASGCQEQK